jgi:hypothetical protein
MFLSGFIRTGVSLHTHQLQLHSNVKHLEEIKSLGYEMPSVNQIEVIVSPVL